MTMTKTVRNELNQYKCSINKMIALNSYYLNVRLRKRIITHFRGTPLLAEMLNCIKQHE